MARYSLILDPPLKQNARAGSSLPGQLNHTMPTQQPAQKRQTQSSHVPQKNQELPASGRGGARKGAGRKPVHGARVVSRSINLPPEAWAMLDAQRGERSRSEEVLRKILRDDLRGG